MSRRQDFEALAIGSLLVVILGMVLASVPQFAEYSTTHQLDIVGYPYLTIGLVIIVTGLLAFTAAMTKLNMMKSKEESGFGAAIEMLLGSLVIFIAIIFLPFSIAVLHMDRIIAFVIFLTCTIVGTTLVLHAGLKKGAISPL